MPPPPTAKQQLQQWFQYLQAFQTACEQACAGLSNETLLNFANDTVATDLATPDEQQNFCIKATSLTSFTITPPDLAASSTFKSLLETVWNPLSMFVLGFIRSCAPTPLSAMGFTDFGKQPLVQVFPKGSADTGWTTLQNGLTFSIPSSCYSAKHQTAANNLVVAAGATVQNLVDLISTMG